MKLRIGCVVAMAALPLPAVFGALEFCGLMSSQGEIRFVLTDTESGQHSPWLTNGQSFLGYTITKFDPRNDILHLQRGTDTLQLTLKAARTFDARSTAKPIFISIAGHGMISIGEDLAMLEVLKAEMKRFAAMVPQPIVAMSVSDRANAAVVKTIWEACRESGIKKLSLSSAGEANPKSAEGR